LWNRAFSHIYVEEEALKYPAARRILEKYPNSLVLPLGHYKDFFCRPRQDFSLQKKSPQLLLAVKRDAFVYEGSRMCDSFGHHNFYYTSSVMNCPYDCEYCYLQGMYPSANIVVFVNIEDTINKISELLSAKGNLYLCVSYDTDLLALEGLTGFLRQWMDFARNNKKLLLEIRTKSANFKAISGYYDQPTENVILAWTLSPREIIDKYEKNTPSLEARLSAMAEAARRGWLLRACFDPVLLTAGWEKLYSSCIDDTFSVLDPSWLLDVSVGVFRVSAEYLKKMRKLRPESEILAYPFIKADGACTYKEADVALVLPYIKSCLEKYLPSEKIFIHQ